MSDFDYDAWAGEKLGNDRRDDVLAWKAEQMEALVPAGMTFSSALEIGCAEGYVIHHIKEQLAIPQCYGADISERFLSRARWFLDRELKRLLPKHAYRLFGGNLIAFFNNENQTIAR